MNRKKIFSFRLDCQAVGIYHIVSITGEISVNLRDGLMDKIQFSILRCKGCGLCIGVCPKHILKMSKQFNPAGNSYVEITDIDECTACGMCFQMCPDLAIEIDKKQ
jgi:2-oxoglutarate ferredoxin oxidoreductase subunit delta